MVQAFSIFIRGSITVQLASFLTGLDSTKLANLYLIQHKQSSRILTCQIEGQLYIDSFLYKVNECSLQYLIIIRFLAWPSSNQVLIYKSLFPHLVLMYHFGHKLYIVRVAPVFCNPTYANSAHSSAFRRRRERENESS